MGGPGKRQERHPIVRLVWASGNLLCALLWVGIVVGDAAAQIPGTAPDTPTHLTTDSPDIAATSRSNMARL